MVVVFLLITLVPIAILTSIGVTLARESLVAQGDINLRADGLHTSRGIDQYLTAHLEDVIVLSNSPAIIAYASNPNDIAARTNARGDLEATVGKTDYSSVAVTNAEGTIILSSSAQEIGTRLQSRDYIQNAINGISYISDPSLSSVTNRPVLYFSAQIRNTAGNAVGVIFSRLDTYGIWALVERDHDVAGPGTVGMLLDENGIRIAHSAGRVDRQVAQRTLLYRAVAPLPDSVATRLASENRLSPGNEDPQVLPLPEVAAQLGAAVPTVFEGAADNSTVRHRAVIVPLESKPWHYVVMAPLPTFTNAADTFARIALGVALVIGVTVALLALFFSRAITQPITQLIRAAELISLGQLDVEIKVDRKDEIGELALAVRRMEASLQAALERLRARRNA